MFYFRELKSFELGAPTLAWQGSRGSRASASRAERDARRRRASRPGHSLQFVPPSFLSFPSFPRFQVSVRACGARLRLLLLSSLLPSFLPSLLPFLSLLLPLSYLFVLFDICRARCARPLRISRELRSHCTRMRRNGAPSGAQSLSLLPSLLPSLLSSSFLLFSSFPLFLTRQLQGSLRSPTSSIARAALAPHRTRTRAWRRAISLPSLPPFFLLSSFLFFSSFSHSTFAGLAALALPYLSLAALALRCTHSLRKLK